MVVYPEGTDFGNKRHAWNTGFLLRRQVRDADDIAYLDTLIDRLIAEHGLAGKVWVYQTKFRGSPWYVVLQGDYAGLTQAKSAIRKLPPALLKGQPWPKSFAQVQKELKQ